MTDQLICPDVVVCVCRNCVPDGGQLSQQWQQCGSHVLVREIPCSGKVNVQYLLHALEGGARGLCLVTCPLGQCRLAEGNYRAEIRIDTVRRLLGEIGLEPERVELLHCSPDDPPDRLKQLVHDAVERIGALGESPVRA